MTQTVVARIEEIAQNVAAADGLEVVEVEVKGSGRNQMLRIYIDKPQGVTHLDCETVSRQLGDRLDAENLFPGHYTLEVSSPGVERKLKKWKDFERFQSQRVKIVLREPLTAAGNVKHLEGVLRSARDGVLELELAGGQQVQFQFEQVDRANLKFEW
ncbi:MAG TPA: ribosome maturation factor RimP [Bryobacteraceae bacterium]